MSDEFDLSRRKVLGGLGTIGAAGALGGASTMAFFSDEETFANNMLRAGELDLKIDFEEHYSDWKGSETDDARMPGENEDPNFVLPAPADIEDARDIELVIPDIEAFSDATSIEAYPDDNNDGLQDQTTVDGQLVPEFPDAVAPNNDICETNSDVPAALNSDLRTNGTVEGQTTESGDPLINLQDVKPGDFGEVTLSFHLCDNPGYVWLIGSEVDDQENDITEPESEDPQEDGTDEGELSEYVQTRLWYDDGDNIFEREPEGNVFVNFVLDHSGSIEENVAEERDSDGNVTDSLSKEVARNTIATDVVDGLDSNDATPGDGTLDEATVAIDYFRSDNSFQRDIGGGTFSSDVSAIKDSITDLGPPDGPSGDGIDDTVEDSGGTQNYTNSGGTDIVAALESAEDSIRNRPDPTSTPFVVFITNSGVTADSQTEANNIADRIKNNLGGTIKVVILSQAGSDVNMTDEGFAQEIATGSGQSAEVFIINQDPGNDGGADDQTVSEVETRVQDVADNIQDQLGVTSPVGPGSGGEEEFFQGTLAELGEAVNFDANNGEFGIPLDGDPRTAFVEVDPDDNTTGDPTSDARECYEPSSTNYIGFEWWLPVDHANQVQGDSASFDIGFYTEQCRHNDGSGQGPE